MLRPAVRPHHYRLGAAGPSADAIARLGWILAAVGAVIFAMVVGVLAASIWRNRHLHGAGIQPDPAARGEALSEHRADRSILTLGAVVPAVVVALALGASVITLGRLPTSAGPQGLVIDVVGYQWWWSATYSRAGVTIANEIHIPVGIPVEFRLTSADVIHSFWVPALGGKTDAFPNDLNTLVLEADRPGVYRGACAEFCGLQHARMRITVVAEPPEQFERWLGRQGQPAPSEGSPDSSPGKALFLSSGCSSCHVVRSHTPPQSSATTAGAADAEPRVGPDLTHLASRDTLAAGTLSATPMNLARWISDPSLLKNGAKMPAAAFNDADLQAIVRYLQSLE